MQNKLQELTDKLYQEGLSKGKEEGERILADAKAQESDAASLRSKAESDVKMASAQALQASKKDIENVLVDSIVKEGVKSELADSELLKDIILAVAKNFSTQESCDLALVLPESLKAQIEPWVSGKLAKELGRGVKAEFSKKIAGGFNIGPADGSWFVSLTDEAFSALISEYLRPVTKKLLFGE